MSHVLYLIDSSGLDNAEKVARATKEWPVKRISELRDQLWEILQTGSAMALRKGEVQDDPFDFVASASMRGEDGCFRWGCRIEKARILSRYAALYARRVLIPIRLGVSPVDLETEANLRYGLAGTILSILEYRPLIENGIVILTAGALCYCKEHLDEAVPSHPKIELASKALFDREFKKFSVSIARRGNPPEFRVTGPEDYLPHGKMMYVPPSSFKEMKRSKALPLAVRKAVVKQFFDSIARDVTMQQYFTTSTDATYLTDLRGEARVLELLRKTDDSEAQNAIFAKHLLHSVPLLNEVPIHTVIKLRQEEPEAFLRYRAAIARIIREFSREKEKLTEKEAKSISGDVLQPELARLRIQASAIRRAGVRKAVAKAAASFAAVGLGVYGGLLPSDLAGLLKVAGGVGLLSQIGEAIGLIERNPQEIKNHELYFLLKLQKAGRRL